ncbi:cellulose synthase-like D1 [Actinidia rufa]|uniref:Cellulose synthase-like D1 n=1 Tax=Actinidia rufa TaxID=165716 RepID=A0A7J0EAA5_9ERIC|nr:cellulose synthase-like D1 [Actinidia rufa]
MATSGGPPKKTSSSSSAPDRPQQGVKFSRRTLSGRVVSLSRDDDLDMSGEFAGPNDYINYTVMMPPTPDNQPGAQSAPTHLGDKPDGPSPYGPTSRFGMESMGRRGGDEDGGGKLDRRMSVMRTNNKSMLLRSQTGDFDHNRWLFETKGKYGIGNAFWQEDENSYDDIGMSMLLVFLRLVVLILFLTWRIQNPNEDALWLWGMSIVCECWFAFTWLLDILPKMNPVNRQTDLAALRDKFETPSPSNPQGRSDLPGVDVFISTADPEKEPPLVTANTILSILAVEYPVEKVSIYISDDGGAILTFEAMAEAVKFGEVWVPFCRKHNIEPRNPDSYFSMKTDPTKNKKRPDFVKDRRWIKREYDEFKVRINGLPDVIRKRCEMYNSKENAQEKKAAREKNGGVLPPDEPIKVMSKVPEHDPVMGHPDEKQLDFTGIDIRLPMFAYVSREKRSGYDHNKKAGAMNALQMATIVRHVAETINLSHLQDYVEFENGAFIR